LVVRAPEITELGDRICAGLLLCQKSNTVYPRGHPRLRAALAGLKAAIEDLYEKSGDGFIFESTLDPASRIGSGPSSADAETLRRLLRMNRIESLVIGAAATDEELFELCLLLDPKRKAETDEIDPLGWHHISLTFFVSRDVPDRAAPSEAGPILERAAGLHGEGGLKDVLEKVPAGLQGSVQQALLDPDFLLKVSTLRASLRKFGSAPGEGEGRIDLISELVRVMIPRSESGDRKDLRPDDVPAALRSYLEFVEKNLDALSREQPSLCADGRKSIELRLLEKLQNAPDISEAINGFQVQKGRLGTLFQTSLRSESPLPGNPGAVPSKAAPERAEREAEGPREERPQSEEPKPEDRLRTVVVEGERMCEEIDEKSLSGYIRVMLELIQREGCEERNLRWWPMAMKSLVSAAPRTRFLQGVVGEVVDFSDDTEIAAGGEILFNLLSPLQPEEILEQIRTVVLPRGGRRQLEGFLDRLSRRDGKRAICLMASWMRQSEGGLRRILEEKLEVLLRTPSLLAAWILEDARALEDPALPVRALEAMTAENITSAFGDIFASTPPDRSAAILAALTAGTPNAEPVFFSAIDRGPPPVRVAALRDLWKHPGDMVIATLIEIVNRNNDRDRFDGEEVEAALGSLARIEHPKAAEFLSGIGARRGWLGYAFIKEIRRALAAVEERGSP